MTIEEYFQSELIIMSRVPRSTDYDYHEVKLDWKQFHRNNLENSSYANQIKYSKS